MEGFDDFEQDLVAADGQTLPSGGYGEQTETDFGGQDAFFMDQGQAIPEYSNNDNSGFGADEYASQQPADATGGFGTFGSLPTGAFKEKTNLVPIYVPGAHRTRMNKA